MTSVEAAIEADQITLDFHLCSPLDNWSVYTTISDGLLAAKAERRDALARHDHAAAARLLLEIIDLTALCAAAAEGLARQRALVLARAEPWPLARMPG